MLAVPPSGAPGGAAPPALAAPRLAGAPSSAAPGLAAAPGGAAPLGLRPLAASPGGLAPGLGVPGGAAPLALPDLQGAARAAMERVLGAQAGSPSPHAAAAGGAPDLAELAHRARVVAAAAAARDRFAATGAIGSQTPHVAPAPTHRPPLPAAAGPAGAAAAPHAAPPAAWGQPQLPASGWGPPAQAGPPPGVWVGPPPRDWRPVGSPPGAALDRASWPGGAVVPIQRDTAQRVGDALYPLVERIRESRAGWVGVIALFGITVPIILLRQQFDVRLRLGVAFITLIFWIQLFSELTGG